MPYVNPLSKLYGIQRQPIAALPRPIEDTGQEFLADTDMGMREFNRRTYGTEDPYVRPAPTMDWSYENRLNSSPGESYDDFMARGGSSNLRSRTKEDLRDPDTSGGEYQPTLPPGTAGITDGDPSLNGGAGSSFQLPPWLQNIIDGVGQGLTNAASSPMLAPALATAYQYYNNADKYGNMAENFSKEANSFGDRSQYVQGLSDLYRDPSSIENSAAYQFRLNQGLNTLGPQQAAKGAGYGNAARAMMDYASGLASTEYDKEWQRRYEAAGGKFDPANSVRAQLDAYKLETDAKNAALGALFTPFAPQPGGTNITNNVGGPGGGVQNPGSIGRDIWNTSTGNLGATGKWISEGANIGKYMLQDGTIVDVTKLADAARNGDQEAIQWLTRISGGGTVDEQLRNLGSFDGGSTGDPYNPDPGGGGGGYGDGTFLNPPIEAPVDPMPDDYIYEGLDFWMEP